MCSFADKKREKIEKSTTHNTQQRNILNNRKLYQPRICPVNWIYDERFVTRNLLDLIWKYGVLAGLSENGIKSWSMKSLFFQETSKKMFLNSVFLLYHVFQMSKEYVF